MPSPYMASLKKHCLSLSLSSLLLYFPNHKMEILVWLQEHKKWVVKNLSETNDVLSCNKECTTYNEAFA